MTIYYQKVKWRFYLHRRGINEYKFNHIPINCMEMARRCIQISGNGYNKPDWMVKLPSRVRSTPTIDNNAKEDTAIPFPCPKNSD
ncbi:MULTISPECIES: hypothetical protein [unclassified Microcoleus]|uniref:hypothetical protein n=1 Tax=unclassified Microcoleus TaxID=2642155 RepID=UPI002FD2C945